MVQEAISERMKAREQRTEITQDKVPRRYWEIAYDFRLIARSVSPAEYLIFGNGAICEAYQAHPGNLCDWLGCILF